VNLTKRASSMPFLSVSDIGKITLSEIAESIEKSSS